MAFSNPYSPVITNIVAVYSTGEEEFNEVPLPFSNPIVGGMTANKQIQIQGMVQNYPGAAGFSINLCKGPKMEPDCALHFNPRFNEGCVVRNALQRGGWGMEERSGGMPFVRGNLFEIIILATAADYKIAVNGKHFAEFRHRMPMKDVKYIYIAGDHMKINFVKFVGGNTPSEAPAGAAYGLEPGYGPPGVAPPPYSAGGFVPPHSHGAAGGHTLHKPGVPLIQPVYGGMLPNRMIYITGVPLSGQRFTINLQDGNGDVLFHFDARMCFGSDRNVVVRNTCTNGNWGPEERSAAYFPFMPNAAFDLIIMATPHSFKVAVNNNHFIEYEHRQPLQRANMLKITGDVRITSVRFQ